MTDGALEASTTARAPQRGGAALAVGKTGPIGKINDVLVRVALLNQLHHGVAANARIKHADRRAQIRKHRRLRRHGV